MPTVYTASFIGYFVYSQTFDPPGILVIANISELDNIIGNR
jgi:hypothetical protein